MAGETDHEWDRRRLERRLFRWRLLAIVAVVAALVALAAGGLSGKGLGPHVARLDVSGLIVSDPERDEALARLAKDDQVKALLVRVDSPGGTVVGGESLYRALRRVAEKKPVVAVMLETGASAAYMTAIAADHVLAHQGSVTGSIGVLLQTADVTGLLDKLGVKPESIKSGALKAQPSPLEPFTEEARRATRDVVLDLHAMFVDLVAERRGQPREAVARLADGRIFTGRQALAAGLVDELGGEAEARRWLAEKKAVGESLPARDVKIDREDGWWRSFLEQALGKALGSGALRLDGVMAVWHPSLR